MAEELIPVGYKLVVLTLDFSESFKERAMAVQKSEKEKKIIKITNKLIIHE